MNNVEIIWSSIAVFGSVAEAARFRFAHLGDVVDGRLVRPTTSRVEGGIRLHFIATR